MTSVDINDEQLMDTELKTYEVGYLLSPFIPEEGIEEVVARIFKSTIEALGGTVTVSPAPRQKKLAYPISLRQGGKKKPYSDAFFGAMRFQLDPSKLAEAKTIFTKAPEMIRYLITVVPKGAGPMTIKVTGSIRVLATPTDETPSEVMPEEKPAELTEAEMDKEIDILLEPKI